MLCAVVSAAIGQRMQTIEDRVARETNLSWQELSERLDERLMAFDQNDAQSLMAELGFKRTGVTITVPPLTPDTAPFIYLLGIAPWIALSSLLHMSILFVASVFFLLLGSRNPESLRDIVVLLPAMCLKTIGLVFWFFVRSFLWFPLIGPILLLFMTPRLALGPALLASGRTGVFLSLRESIKLTKGHWFFVALSLFSLLIITLLILWLGVLLVAATTLFSAKLGFFLWLLFVMFLAAMQMFFLVKLKESMD